MPVPDFNKDIFPFLIVTGISSIALLNVKTGNIEPLVKTKASSSYDQQAFFFQKSEYSVKLNIACNRQMLNGNRRLEWIQMELKPQLLEILKRIGELPVSNMKQLLHVQEECVQFRAAKQRGNAGNKQNLVNELNRRKKELEKQRSTYDYMIRQKQKEMT